MFCGKCGKEIEDGAMFCPFCGKRVKTVVKNVSDKTAESNGNTDVSEQGTTMNANKTASETTQSTADVVSDVAKSISENVSDLSQNIGAKATTAKDYAKNHKPQIFLIVGAVVLIAFIITIVSVIAANKKTVINPEKYVEVAFEGYDGYGSADFEISKNEFLDKYGKKIKWSRNVNKSLKKVIAKNNLNCTPAELNAALEGKYGHRLKAAEFVYNMIYNNAGLDESELLKNNDAVTFDCFDGLSESHYSVSSVVLGEEEMRSIMENVFKVKVKKTSFEYTVNGLKVVPTFDAFENIKISYEGAEPTVRAYLETNEENGLFYAIENGENVREGDILNVCASLGLDSIDSYIEQYGRIPETMTKEYVVEALPHYATSASEISEEVLNEMKMQSEDVIQATTYNWINGFTLTPTYVGNYFLTAKSEDNMTQNMFVLVYKLHYSNGLVDYSGEAKEYGIDYYFYVNWDNIIRNPDGTCSYTPDRYWKSENEFSVYTGVYRDRNKSYGNLYNEYKLTFKGYPSIEDIYDCYINRNIEYYRYEDNIVGVNE